MSRKAGIAAIAAGGWYARRRWPRLCAWAGWVSTGSLPMRRRAVPSGHVVILTRILPRLPACRYTALVDTQRPGSPLEAGWV